MFLFWAWLTPLTTALIECNHARNNRTANKTLRWVNFAARVLNRESVEIHQARRELVPQIATLRGEDGADAVPTLPVTSLSQSEGSFFRCLTTTAQTFSTKTLLSRRAQHQSRATGSRLRVSPMLADRVTSDVDNMSSSDFDNMRTLATLSRYTAFATRIRRSSSLSATSDRSLSTTTSSLSHSAIALTASEFSADDAIDIDTRKLINCEMNAADMWIGSSSPTVPRFGERALLNISSTERAELFVSPDKSFPISTPHLTSFVANTPGKLKGITDNFKAIVNQFGTGVVASDPFPQSVTYDTRCPAWCDYAVGPHYKKMCETLLSRMTVFRASKCKPADTPDQQFLFVFEITHRARRAPSLVFAVMPISSGACGRLKPHYVFGLLHPRADDFGKAPVAGQYSGLTLDRVCDDVIHSRCWSRVYSRYVIFQEYSNQCTQDHPRHIIFITQSCHTQSRVAACYTMQFHLHGAFAVASSPS